MKRCKNKKNNRISKVVFTYRGKIVERASKNTNMPTGEIEVVASEIEVLGKCKNVLPFEINTDQEVMRDL